MQGAWVVSTPRALHWADDNATYPIPLELVGGVTQCEVRGCYKPISGRTTYLTNNVTVDCFSEVDPQPGGFSCGMFHAWMHVGKGGEGGHDNCCYSYLPTVLS